MFSKEKKEGTSKLGKFKLTCKKGLFQRYQQSLGKPQRIVWYPRMSAPRVEYHA